MRWTKSITSGSRATERWSEKLDVNKGLGAVVAVRDPARHARQGSFAQRRRNGRYRWRQRRGRCNASGKLNHFAPVRRVFDAYCYSARVGYLTAGPKLPNSEQALFTPQARDIYNICDEFGAVGDPAPAAEVQRGVGK